MVVAIGAVACGVCGLVVFGQPTGSPPILSLHNDPQLFGGSRGADTRSFQEIRQISGIGGETFRPGETVAEVESMLNDGSGIDAAPASWGDLSQSHCLTVTTESGETFSFRILGVSPDTAEHDAAAGGLKLAIEGCADQSGSVVKAIIEPETRSGPEKAVPERSL